MDEDLESGQSWGSDAGSREGEARAWLSATGRVLTGYPTDPDWMDALTGGLGLSDRGDAEANYAEIQANQAETARRRVADVETGLAPSASSSGGADYARMASQMVGLGSVVRSH